MRSGKMERLSVPEPQKKRGVPILTWLILGVLGIVGTWYLLENRAALQRASDTGQAAPPPAEPVMGALPPTTAANFNPKNLDPASSGQLQLGFDSFPSAILLSVEVDGGKFWSGVAGSSNGSALVIPAGRHNVRVVAYGTGADTIFSNNASGAFSAGRRLLLLTELKPEPPSGISVLPPGTRIVLIVKPQ